MVFVGRSEPLGLIDRMTTVPVDAGIGAVRPVLVVQGCGGSGRSALLERAHVSWRGRAPVALVHADRVPGDEESAVRPLLAAAMLALSDKTPGYSISFERVLLAYIAIKAQIGDFGVRAAKEKLRRSINEYRNRELAENLVRDLVNAAGSLAANIPAPGASTVAPAVANSIAEAIVTRLRLSRWRSRLDWSTEALEWFGHQGQDLHLDYEEVLIRLSAQAMSDLPETRHEVDDVLVAALLADMRHSAAETANRPANLLILLDAGDMPSAISFISALLRVRAAVTHTPGAADRRLPDPLTLVTTSGGALTTHLTRHFPMPDGTDEVPWHRVDIGDLQQREVIQLARNDLWSDGVTAASVGRSAYRLTHGHAESTAYVLQRLRADPRLADDIGELLRRDGPEHPVGLHLLRPFVRGLSADRHVDDTLLEALITLSAVRDRLHIPLVIDLLPPPIDIDSAVLVSPTLWSRRNGGGQQLHPMARYLGLRALASRPETDPACWNSVLHRLRDGVERDDLASRLHYSRLLGERAAVGGELAALLPVLPTATWLELFDRVVGVPDPRLQDIDVIQASGVEPTATGHTFRLLGVIPALDADPCTTSADLLKSLRAHARFSYRQLATCAQDPVPLILRADLYT